MHLQKPWRLSSEERVPLRKCERRRGLLVGTNEDLVLDPVAEEKGNTDVHVWPARRYGGLWRTISSGESRERARNATQSNVLAKRCKRLRLLPSSPTRHPPSRNSRCCCSCSHTRRSHVSRVLVGVSVPLTARGGWVGACEIPTLPPRRRSIEVFVPSVLKICTMAAPHWPKAVRRAENWLAAKSSRDGSEILEILVGRDCRQKLFVSMSQFLPLT